MSLQDDIATELAKAIYHEWTGPSQTGDQHTVRSTEALVHYRLNLKYRAIIDSLANQITTMVEERPEWKPQTT